jgi:acetate kinase
VSLILGYFLERRAQGESRATAALEAFIYHLKKAIGAYHAILGGAEAIVLTATASQRSPELRRLIIESLDPCRCHFR